MAMMFETQPTRPIVALPTQRTGWQRHFPTIDVVATRTANFMATITAYGYRDIAKGPDSKYMFRPTGGALSCLWLEGHGLVQASSQTEYHRWEPMHFPEAPGLRPITPRIEYTAGKDYFTNLYEFDARLTVREPRAGEFTVSAYGELKDRNWHYGGVSYRLTHSLQGSALEKTITLYYRGAAPEVRIVEPIIAPPGLTFVTEDARTVRIDGGGRRLRLQLVEGEATLVVGRDAAHTWSPYPALRAHPVEFVVAAPRAEVLSQTIRLRLSVE